MHRKIILSLCLAFLSLALVFGQAYPIEQITIEQKSVSLQSGIEDSGSLRVFLCPRDDCEGHILRLLGQAEQSIHCALYDIGLTSLQQLLIEKAKSIDVRLVTDNDYSQKCNKIFVKPDAFGEMHNKFCIIDQQWLFTGSTNPTENGVQKNNNNLLITDLPTLVGNYEDEFAELWNGTFKKGREVKNQIIFAENTTIQNYFCPEDNCAQQISRELEKAKRSIYFMTFSFTHEKIANILLLKNLDGVSVEGVIERRQATKDSPFQRFNQNGISTLKDGNPQTMHHKVFIIDDRTVITGSMNPTNNGNERNDENVLIIDSEEIAQQFLNEYRRVRAEAERAANIAIAVM